jgi:RNA polymerase sigma factor (sigma-70 family)
MTHGPWLRRFVGATSRVDRRFTSEMTEPQIQARTAAEPGTRDVQRLGRASVLDAWDRHHGEIFAFLLDATRDAAAAEDLLQEAFTRLLREERAGRMPEQVRPWLYRVATNLALSRGRRLLSARRWFDRVGVPSHREAAVESPEGRLLDREAFEDLDAALGVLPADARTALLLAAEGFSGREIATALGRTDSAVRTMLCRARIRVRNELAETGGTR